MCDQYELSLATGAAKRIGILNRSSALSAHAAFEMGDEDLDDGVDGDLF
jgi:hypothetical protein